MLLKSVDTSLKDMITKKGYKPELLTLKKMEVATLQKKNIFFFAALATYIILINH